MATERTTRPSNKEPHPRRAARHLPRIIKVARYIEQRCGDIVAFNDGRTWKVISDRTH